MNASYKFLLSSIAAAALAACGGNDSTSSNTTSSTAGSTSSTVDSTTTTTVSGTPGDGANLTPTTAPSAQFAATQSEANALAKEAKDGLASAQGAANSSSLPLGIQTASLPTGVTTDLSAIMCAKGTALMDAPAALPSAGYSISQTYTNCELKQLAGYAYNGSFKLTYSRYASPLDATFTATFTNFSLTSPTMNLPTYNGSVTCDYKGSAIDFASACYYSDGSRAWSSKVTYSGGAATGSYVASYGNGTVKVEFSNFGTTGGKASFTGANGYSAVVTYNSATSYTVEITANANKTSYSVSF